MNIYRIDNTISGASLGFYLGTSEEEAITAMLNDAGNGGDMPSDDLSADYVRALRSADEVPALNERIAELADLVDSEGITALEHAEAWECYAGELVSEDGSGDCVVEFADSTSARWVNHLRRWRAL